MLWGPWPSDATRAGCGRPCAVQHGLAGPGRLGQGVSGCRGAPAGRYCVVFPDSMKTFGSTWCVTSGPVPEGCVCAGRWLWPTWGAGPARSSRPFACRLPQGAVFAHLARSPPWALWSTPPGPGVLSGFFLSLWSPGGRGPSPLQPLASPVPWGHAPGAWVGISVTPAPALSASRPPCLRAPDSSSVLRVAPPTRGFYLPVCPRVRWLLAWPRRPALPPPSPGGPLSTGVFLRRGPGLLCLPAWSFKRNF